MSTLMVLVETPSGLVTEPALSQSGLMTKGVNELWVSFPMPRSTMAHRSLKQLSQDLMSAASLPSRASTDHLMMIRP
jgi:hypothetical protein